MTVLVTNESGQDYRFTGHSNQKLFPSGATMMLSDEEWHSVITGKRGPGQLNPIALPVDASVTIPPLTVDPAPPYALATRLDDVGGTPDISYVGEADPGSLTSDAVWRVKRITDDGTDVTVEWAGGISTFNQVWDDRASLTYS